MLEETNIHFCTGLDANPKGPCVFPFIFNHTSYSSCTRDGISNKKPWCSLTKNYDIDFQWAYCEPSGRMVACKGFMVFFFVLSERKRLCVCDVRWGGGWRRSRILRQDLKKMNGKPESGTPFCTRDFFKKIGKYSSYFGHRTMRKQACCFCCA